MRHIAVAVAYLIFHVDPSYADVTWQQQAERLQQISATLLDGAPLGDPTVSRRGADVHATVSFLPKVNPKVGGKSEDVPSSPVHMVPTFRMGHKPSALFSGNAGYQIWAGYLPAGGEKLVNLDAKLSQYLAGAAVTYDIPLSQISYIQIPIGAQTSSASVKGAITAKNSNDSFSANTTLFYLAPGIVTPIDLWMGPGDIAWLNVMLGGKSTSSDFKIPADDTNFKINDSRTLAQIAVGVHLSKGFEVGAGYLYVPERLMMPRLRVGYQFAF